jgi:hypothetical protein
MKKVTFFKKIQNSIPYRSKKQKQFQKKFFYEVLVSIRRINVQKINQIGDDHWSLSSKKPLLSEEFLKKVNIY